MEEAGMKGGKTIVSREISDKVLQGRQEILVMIGKSGEKPLLHIEYFEDSKMDLDLYDANKNYNSQLFKEMLLSEFIERMNLDLDGIKRMRDKSKLAESYLNVVNCSKCGRPKNKPYVCIHCGDAEG